MEEQTPSTERTRVRRLPERGRYDRGSIEAILDEARICHLGFVVNGQPFVIPTIHARIGDRVYVHGSTASRTLTVLRDGVPICLTVTILDGLVVARSVFEHSMNYRSVVVLGSAYVIDDPEEKLAGLRAISNTSSPADGARRGYPPRPSSGRHSFWPSASMRPPQR